MDIKDIMLLLKLHCGDDVHSKFFGDNVVITQECKTSSVLLDEKNNLVHFINLGIGNGDNLDSLEVRSTTPEHIQYIISDLNIDQLKVFLNENVTAGGITKEKADKIYEKFKKLIDKSNTY